MMENKDNVAGRLEWLREIAATTDCIMLRQSLKSAISSMMDCRELRELERQHPNS